MAESGWIVESLERRHATAAFDCGIPSLNEYIQKYASQNQKTGVSQTFVALKSGDENVRGYYSIAAGAVALTDVPEEMRKRLPRYPLPVAHLGRLAVDRSTQGKRLGEFLLIDALRRIQIASDSIGIHAVEVVAINDEARNFYLKYGFTALLDDPQHLYISMKTVMKLGLI